MFAAVVGAALIVTPACYGEEPAREEAVADAHRAAALAGRGDVDRGRRLFGESRAACATCHTVDGRGGKAGPDLVGVADKFDRAGLVRAVLEPSADLLPGYEAVVVVTEEGNVYSGVLKAADERQLELMAADGKTTRVGRGEIEEQAVSRQSLMPERFQVQATPGEFADLIAYLETLRRPRSSSTRPEDPEEIPRASRPLTLTPFLGPEMALERPVWFGPLPGRAGEYLVAEIERARVWRIVKSAEGDRKEAFVDLHAQTRHGYIEGILGVALHPRFAENARYFLAMHDSAADRVVVNVWERRANGDRTADAGEEPRKLLAVETPHVNHNGCCLEFGPDGLLYVSFGDGGPQEDPNGYAQNPGSLLGKILRIDVDRTEGERPYAIPADNPFRDTPGARPEVWALGFREPWRFSFDRETGELWVGDVGQNRFEEVAVVRAGENHGWNVVEGFEPFSARYRRDGDRYVPPVLAYSHRHGVSVTGGYVYRGSTPALRGMYVFGDFETRKIWGLTLRDGRLGSLVELGRPPSRIAAFGEDEEGELYLVGHDPATIYRLDLSAVDVTPASSRELLPTSENAAVIWRYTLERPGEGWERPEFDDSSWSEAPGGFGTRGTPGAVVRTEWRTGDIWLRREFTAGDDVGSIDASSLALRVHHDEDAEVFLNGVAAAAVKGFTGSYVELPVDAAAAKAMRPGRNVVAVHCRQTAGGQYVDVGVVVYGAGGERKGG